MTHHNLIHTESSDLVLAKLDTKMPQQLSGLNTVSNQGFIAVTSVIVMSLLLVTITTALSMTNYFSRYNILENEFKERSSTLAEACVDSAIGSVASNSAYLPPVNPIPVGPSNSCKILSITPGGFPKTITTQAVFPASGNQSFTTLEVVVGSNLKVQSWKEIP